MPANNAIPAIGLSLAIVLYGCYKFITRRLFYRGKPGPPHSLLWGHSKAVAAVTARMPPNMHLQAIMTEVARTYNLEEIFYLDMWPLGLKLVVIESPALSEQVSLIKRYPQHPLGMDFLNALVGPGAMAAMNGAPWKRLHRAMSPAWSFSYVQGMPRSIADETRIFCRNLAEKAASGEAFSMEELGGKLIFDVVGRVILKLSLNAQSTGSELLDDIKGIVEVAEISMKVENILNPIQQLRIWRKKRGIAKSLDPKIRKMIQERSAALVRGGEDMKPSKERNRSILELLVDDFQKENNEHMTVTVSPEQSDLVLANVKSFLLAAQGTTNTILSFIFMLLSNAPEVVEKMRAEHVEVLGDDVEQAVDRLVENPDLLQKLVYTEAVSKESLRLFPIGNSPKIAAKGQTLTHQGREYPMDDGQAVFLNGHGTHYNPRYFPEPTKFRPERWLDAENRIPKGYLRTFSTGPRSCGGQNMAHSIYKIILLMTMSEFEFACADSKPNAVPRALHTDLDTIFGDRIFQRWAVEAKPRGGMMMTVKRRSKGHVDA